MTSRNTQRLLENAPPAVLRLARAVCLATRIEPELLRRARLELFADMDMSAEADLWFSHLVASRSARWMVLRTDVARELRTKLASDPELLRNAWRLVETAHANAAPAIRLEEEVIYLALAGGEGADEAIDKILGGVLHAVTAGHRSGLLDWATRALPALPDRAQATESALALAALVSPTAIGRGTMPGPLRNPGMAAAVAQALPVTDLWLRLVDNGPQMRLDLSRKPMDGAKSISVPGTDPVVVEIRLEEEDRFLLRLPQDLTRSLMFSAVSDVELRTVTGTVYRIARDWIWKEHKAVLVAGPATKLSPWLREISYATGLMLAQEGYLLITGGGTGVEQLAAQGFASMAAKSAGPRMRHYIGPRRRPAVTLGKVVQTRSDRSWARNAVARSHAVVIFEGGPRTEMLGEQALDTGKKLIPVGDRGAAKRLRSRAEEDYGVDYTRFGELDSSDGDVTGQVNQIRDAIAQIQMIDVMRGGFAPDGEEYAR